ncbi:MAG: hypothetical protein WAU69_05685 [Solirubrobacteraceae bacterium]
MRSTTPQERATAGALAGLMLILAVVHVVTKDNPGPGVFSPTAIRADLLPLLGAALLIALALASLRLVFARRALRSRVQFELLPADTFDPSLDAIRRFAGQLARTRRGFLLGWLERPGSAVRILIAPDRQGVLRYRLEVPERARTALDAALTAYSQLEARECDPLPFPDAGHTVRVELRLAHEPGQPLGDPGLDPDPLQGIAGVLGRLHGPAEGAIVAIDLLPKTPAQSRRLRKRMFKDAARRAGVQSGGALDGLLGQQPRAGRRPAADAVDRLFQTRALQRKLDASDPLFATQILLCVRGRERAPMRALTHALLSCFDVFAGENHLRAAGLRFGGLGFLGADAPWRRGRFDRRLHSGRFAPVRASVLCATEIAGLLKPPTARCHVENVARSGGAIPPPPPGLPTYSGQKGLIPLGKVSDRGGERIVGVPVAGTFFAYMAGRSRYGKTETAIGQFIALARSGHGGLFLDPHADAIKDIKPYLTDAGIRERVVEINLADLEHDTQAPAWNLFALERRTPAEAAGKVEAFVDALAAALRWDERNTRALNLATQAGQALVELALALPPEFAPTIFQVPTLLSDDEWRAAILPALSAGTRGFFEDRFPRLPAEAVTAVTNLIDRLRAARPVAAFLGSPISTYDARRAMRDGLIVLACPGSGSTRDRLVANLLVYDVLHAAKARASIAPERRRTFWLFCDELQTYDGPNLPALLEQSAKYGGRAFLFNQNPERLTEATWNAVTTNRSHLLSSTVNAKAASMIAREWGGHLDGKIITGLARYTYLASITHGERTTKPFLVHGITARELHAEHHHPEQLPALEAAIQTTTRREPIAQTLATHEHHDQNIRQAVEALHHSSAAPSGDPVSRGRTIRPVIPVEEAEQWDS